MFAKAEPRGWTRPRSLRPPHRHRGASRPPPDDALDRDLSHTNGGHAIERGPPPGSCPMWVRGHACATAPTMVTEPPAFSIASTADLDAPATSKVTFAVNS